jgi:hypothetical protein
VGCVALGAGCGAEEDDDEAGCDGELEEDDPPPDEPPLDEPPPDEPPPWDGACVGSEPPLRRSQSVL